MRRKRLSSKTERLLNNDTVLYENLTDEEADRIINELLKSGETNKDALEKLQKQVLSE